MLVTKTVLAERVFSIYISQDSGETWDKLEEFGVLIDAIKFCHENNQADTLFSYIVVPSDRTVESVSNVL